MPKLFLKIGRIGNPRTFAWDSATRGSVGIDKHRYRMTESEEGEFQYLLDHGRHTCLGAGGQYEYRTYDALEAPEWPYAIVAPDSAKVREQYPNACRLVNLSTGRESALCDTVEHARETLQVQRAGKARGSFA